MLLAVIEGELMKTPQSQDQYDRQARVGLLVNVLQTKLETSLDRALKPFDVSTPQYVVVSAIANGRAETAAQLCKEISYSPGAMTRMLNRLETKDLICRTVQDDNMRARKLSLTENGKRLYPQLKSASVAVVTEIFAPLGAEELTTIETILRKIAG